MCVASDGPFRDLKAITKTVARNMPRKKNARLIKSWGSRGMTADRRIMVEIYDRVQVEDAGKKREQRVKSFWFPWYDISCRKGNPMSG